MRGRKTLGGRYHFAVHVIRMNETERRFLFGEVTGPTAYRSVFTAGQSCEFCA